MKNKDASQSDLSREQRPRGETVNLIIGSVLFVLLVLLCALAFYVFFARGEMS